MPAPEPDTLYKPAAASRRYNFDFSCFAEVVDDGETLTAATVTADASGLTIGTPAVSGAVAQVRISGGNVGVYLLTCAATTSGGNTLVQEGYLEVT